MGKKNKNNSKNDNGDKTNLKDSGIQKKLQKNKLNKKMKPEKAAMAKNIEDEDQTSNICDIKESSQLENNTSIIPEKLSRKRPKDNKKNKKIILANDNEDDEPRNVSLNSNGGTRKKNLNQNYEEEPKDEDIDKFCDEIDEEDNEQYENWIKLVETKLSSNKKKV